MNEIVELQPGEVMMFGYGSLLLRSSMERTLGRAYQRQRYPCRVRGWRRTWNSLYPNERFYYLDYNGERKHPKNILYLNVSASADLLNGVLYVISEQELAAFDEREGVYTRVDIQEQLTDIQVRGGPAWMYLGKAEYLLKDAVPATEAAIRRTYIGIVEAGLTELGPEFRAGYLASSDAPPEANIIDDRMD